MGNSGERVTSYIVQSGVAHSKVSDEHLKADH